METLTKIPFTLDIPAMMKRVHAEAGTDDEKDFRALAAQAMDVGRPKAAFRECFVEAKGEDTVTVEGVTFTSAMLRKNLEKADRVFAFVITCGREMDEVKLASDNFLADFWWDTIKAELLNAARAHLVEHLDRRFRLAKTAAMSPGSGDVETWRIEEQRLLFSLLGDVRGGIGVELTDSFLMVPNKTVSGLRFPTEKDFRTCQVCRRAICPNRAAPFDKALWESLQHE